MKAQNTIRVVRVIVITRYYFFKRSIARKNRAGNGRNASSPSGLVFHLDVFIAIIRFNYIRPAIWLRSVRVISIRYKYRASFVCLLFSSSLFFFPFPRFLEHATTRSGAPLLPPTFLNYVGADITPRSLTITLLPASHELRGIIPPARQIFASSTQTCPLANFASPLLIAGKWASREDRSIREIARVR